jgi:hypothetical protein
MKFAKYRESIIITVPEDVFRRDTITIFGASDDSPDVKEILSVHDKYSRAGIKDLA